MIRKITALFFVSNMVSCVSVKKSDVKKELLDPPIWVEEDCKIISGSYYFVGYGEGENQIAALSNARQKARENALICVFGGAYSLGQEIRETGADAKYQSRTTYVLDVSSVDWEGFEMVSGKIKYLTQSRTNVYTQYAWSVDRAKNSKKSFDNLKNEMEKQKLREDAMRLKNELREREIEEKEKAIEVQKIQLEKLRVQEEQIRKLEDLSDRARAKMKQQTESSRKKKDATESVLKEVPCGTTVEQFSTLYREPDRAFVRLYDGKHKTDVIFVWGTHYVEVSWHFPILKDYFQYSSFYKGDDEPYIERAKKSPILSFQPMVAGAGALISCAPL